MERKTARVVTKNIEITLPPDEIRAAIRRAARAPEDAHVEFDLHDTGNSVEFKGATVTFSKTSEPKAPAPATPAAE